MTTDEFIDFIQAKWRFTFVGKRTKKIFFWEKLRSMENWFADNIVLTKGNIKGAFRIKYAPHLVEIMKDIDKSRVKIVTLKSASQIVKTTFGVGAILKYMDTTYDDLFIMIPRANDIKKFLEFKIKPLMNACKSVKDKIDDYSQDEAERKNSFFYKTAQNLLAIISANDTKTITARWMLFDEAAEFPADVILEALERAKTYDKTGYKAIITSTQMYEDDAINFFFNNSEVKKQYFMHCLHCKDFYYPMREHLEYQSLEDYKKEFEIENMTQSDIQSEYKPHASKTPFLKCPLCGGLMNESEREQAILQNLLKWFQVRAVVLANGELNYERVKKDKVDYESVGYDINTLCIANVGLKTFVQKEIEATYAPISLQDSLWSKYFLGFLNKIYVSKNKETVKKNDILKISNGLSTNVVPLNTLALVVGVDLQKTGIYITVSAIAENMNLHIMNYLFVNHESMGLDFAELERIIDAEYFTNDNKKVLVSAVGIDIRGFSKEAQDGEYVSRRGQAMAFISGYIEKMTQRGETNTDSFIFPMLGYPTLPNDGIVTSFKMPYYREGVMEKEEPLKITSLKHSNRLVKDRVFGMINRSIKKSMAKKDDIEFTYKAEMVFINEDVVTLAEERHQLPYGEQRQKHSLESHLSSEHLIRKTLANGRETGEEIYAKKYDSVRNDYLDCICETVAICSYLNYDTKKIVAEDAYSALEDIIKNM